MPLQTTELLQPITPAKPGGEDLRYDPIYEQIKQARIEEDDLPTGDWERARKTADYALVVKLATDVLSKRSKDLQVAAWLTEALLKREGFVGLRSGLDLLAAMITGLWDHLYPEAEDDDLEFRAAPVDWVGKYLVVPIRLTPINVAGHSMQQYRDSRTIIYEKDAFTTDEKDAREQAIQSGRLVPEKFDEAFAATSKAWYRELIGEIDKSLQSLEKLDAIARDKFGSYAPRVSPMQDAMLEVRQVAAQLLTQKLELDPDPIPEPDVSLYADPGSGGGGATTISVVPTSRPDAESRIAAAARFLRAEKPTDPAAYLLLRGFRWGELRSGNGEVNPKLLAAPPTELRARLRGLLLDARWPELLEAGEDVMATPFGRGWLDLQRYILTACNALGGDYEQVGKSIHGALRGLLLDLPQLPTLVLMDDTPTANTETIGWLREQQLLSTDDATASTPAFPSTTPNGRSAGHAVFLRAMEKVRSGEPEQGIDLLIKQALQERSARDRFLRKSEAAQIMVDIGRDAIALPILEDLLREIDQHTLEDWEAGETVAQPMSLLFRCMRRMQGETAETQSLYLRICRLDPMRAMEIDGSAAS